MFSFADLTDQCHVTHDNTKEDAFEVESWENDDDEKAVPDQESGTEWNTDAFGEGRGNQDDQANSIEGKISQEDSWDNCDTGVRKDVYHSGYYARNVDSGTCDGSNCQSDAVAC